VCNKWQKASYREKRKREPIFDIIVLKYPKNLKRFYLTNHYTRAFIEKKIARIADSPYFQYQSKGLPMLPYGNDYGDHRTLQECP
jgi:hypothetical protein